MGKSRGPEILSKMLAYVLGRRPDEFGLVPDAEGFVRIKDLLKALNEEAEWSYVRLPHLTEVLLSVPGAPFEIRENRIRCLRREPESTAAAAPTMPKLLYTSVRRRAYPVVHAEGIRPSGHPGVLLAAEREMALRLGRRIDAEAVVLTVNVRSARAGGVVLLPAGEGLFTADRLPAECLSGPALPKERSAEESSRIPAEQRPLPGSFMLEVERAVSAPVPPSLKRRAEKERRKGRHGRWTRSKPPWKE